MQTYLFSIHPKWCEKIFNGEKTIEVRKSAPKPPFKVVVYCTKKGNDKLKNQLVKMDDTGELKLCSATNLSAYRLNGKVIGEFICEKVDTIVYTGASYEIKGETTAYTNQVARDSCLDFPDLRAYLGVKGGKALHITAPKLYGEPKELGEFYSIKQCKPEYSPFGYQWTWEDRHKRKTGGWDKEYRPVPIECHRCKSLVGGKDYLDEKSGCILFDYECISNYHKPLARPPQSYMRIQCTGGD